MISMAKDALQVGIKRTSEAQRKQLLYAIPPVGGILFVCVRLPFLLWRELAEMS
jgi:hypothetical protein